MKGVTARAVTIPEKIGIAKLAFPLDFVEEISGILLGLLQSSLRIRL